MTSTEQPPTSIHFPRPSVAPNRWREKIARNKEQRYRNALSPTATPSSTWLNQGGGCSIERYSAKFEAG